MITSEQIETSFTNTNFGDRDHATLLQQGVLKVQAGWRCGSTLMSIMRELGLISKTNNTVLKKGRLFLYESFKNSKCTG